MNEELLNALIKANKEIKELFPYYRSVANETLRSLVCQVEQESYNSIASDYSIEFKRIKELIKKNDSLISSFEVKNNLE